jgi:hypothetical protein
MRNVAHFSSNDHKYEESGSSVKLISKPLQFTQIGRALPELALPVTGLHFASRIRVNPQLVDLLGSLQCETGCFRRISALQSICTLQRRLVP